MLDMVNGIYEFPSIIYTLYATKDTDQEVIDFAASHSIEAVTIPESRAKPDFLAKLKKAGITAYVNTINDPSEIGRLQRMGVTGVYSDFVTEQELGDNRWLVALGW